MSYRIVKADGTVIVVKDYEKQIIGGLSILGYGFSNYGDEVAQNTVKQLENNASIDEPENPLLGQFWMSLPVNTSDSKFLKICVNPLAALSANRWSNLFEITSGGELRIDAYTVRGKGLAAPNGSTPSGSTDTIVQLDSNGKINSAYLPAQTVQTNVQTSNQLANSRTFGSRNGGLSFNGTQDVPLTTSHIAEGDQQYFTTARVRTSISGSGAISYDSNTGVISYNPPPASAAVNSFNGRTGTVTLTGGDVTGALGYTPFNNAGGTVSGDARVNGDFINERFKLVADSSGTTRIQNVSSGLSPISSLTMNSSLIAFNGQKVWFEGNDGAGSGLDADTLDGLHASDLLANSQFPSSLNTPGWQRLSSGLIIQWGSVPTTSGEGSTSVTFPIAFPNICSSIVATAVNGSVSNEHDFWLQIVNKSTTSASLYYNSADGGGNNQPGFYMAIGW